MSGHAYLCTGSWQAVALHIGLNILEDRGGLIQPCSCFSRCYRLSQLYLYQRATREVVTVIGAGRFSEEKERDGNDDADCAENEPILSL